MPVPAPLPRSIYPALPALLLTAGLAMALAGCPRPSEGNETSSGREVRTSGKGFYCFLAHCDTAPFDNNDLRLALKYAIDRQAILDRILGGYGTLGNDYPINANYALAPGGPVDGRLHRVVGVTSSPDQPEGSVARVVRAPVTREGVVVRTGEVLAVREPLENGKQVE